MNMHSNRYGSSRDTWCQGFRLGASLQDIFESPIFFTGKDIIARGVETAVLSE